MGGDLFSGWRGAKTRSGAVCLGNNRCSQAQKTFFVGIQGHFLRAMTELMGSNEVRCDSPTMRSKEEWRVAHGRTRAHGFWTTVHFGPHVYGVETLRLDEGTHENSPNLAIKRGEELYSQSWSLPPRRKATRLTCAAIRNVAGSSSGRCQALSLDGGPFRVPRLEAYSTTSRAAG